VLETHSLNAGPGTTYAVNHYGVYVNRERRKVMETILIIIVLLVLFGGGGFYWRGRRR